jgi:superfamily II DNA/RNA helicase
VETFEKRDKLIEILKDAPVQSRKTLIFVEKKKAADFLAAYLSQTEVN